MEQIFTTLVRLAAVVALVAVPLLASAGDGVDLKVGDTAPDVTLTSHEGKEVPLSSLWAESPLVVYFFPKAFTPG
jgi:cytochrome oxidase Cu insertion factor (SCO1/SenC/PrrC family)